MSDGINAQTANSGFLKRWAFDGSKVKLSHNKNFIYYLWRIFFLPFVFVGIYLIYLSLLTIASPATGFQNSSQATNLTVVLTIFVGICWFSKPLGFLRKLISLITAIVIFVTIHLILHLTLDIFLSAEDYLSNIIIISVASLIISIITAILSANILCRILRAWRNKLIQSFH